MKYFKNKFLLFWRIEYQQRGLPHAHIFIWFDYDIFDVERFDTLINSSHLVDDTNVANFDITSPVQLKLFCLGLLLINFPARSFDDAKTRGLIDSTQKFFDCMEEAFKCNYPRSDKVQIALYDKYYEILIEDFHNERDLKKEQLQ